MTKFDIADGKYTVMHNNGADFKALRYGEPWRDLTGDGFVLALVQEIERLKAEARSAVPTSGPNLLSDERAAVRTFLLMRRDLRKGVLEAAIKNPKTSGSLIEVYRYLLHA